MDALLCVADDYAMFQDYYVRLLVWLFMLAWFIITETLYLAFNLFLVFMHMIPILFINVFHDEFFLTLMVLRPCLLKKICSQTLILLLLAYKPQQPISKVVSIVFKENKAHLYFTTFVFTQMEKYDLVDNTNIMRSSISFQVSNKVHRVSPFPTTYCCVGGWLWLW